jgi:arylsulfatase A-like enzyme
MSVEIYSTPEEITRPSFNRETWQEDEKKFIDQIAQWLKDNGYNTKYSGKVIKIPHADSYAYYMVIGLKPLEIFHLDIGDGWHSEFAELLTVAKVKQMVEREKALQEMFGTKQ